MQLQVLALLCMAATGGCKEPVCKRKLTCPDDPGVGGVGIQAGGAGGSVGGSGGDAGQGEVGGNSHSQNLVATDIALGFEPFSNSSGNACAIADGDVWCWTQDAAPTKVQGLPFMAQVEVGAWHVCARSVANEIYCWGENTDGQLGTGTFESTITPVLVTAVPSATQVRVGIYHSCATDDGQVWCWGSDQLGQVGDGTVPQQLNDPYPSLVQNLTSVTTLSQGFSNTTCAVRSTGSVSCWGSNIFGQSAGMITNLYQAEMVNGFSSIADMAIGIYSACARAQGGVLYCIGSDSYGVVNNAGMDAEYPVLFSGLVGVEQVAVGHHHACVVLADKTVRCWGRNHKGQLGNGDLLDQPSSVPVEPLGIADVTEVVAARDATCARTYDGAIYCWGDAPSGASLTPELVELRIP